MRLPDMRRLARRAAGELDHFCEEWIGWKLPPVHRAIEEAQWSPTPRGRYCHRCGQTVGEGEASAAGCGACRGTSVNTDGIIRLGSFSEHLREWIIQVKYHGWSEMGRRLGCELGRALREADIVDPSKTVVTPIPMPWLRRMHRGIDHADVIARGLADEADLQMVRVLAKANGPTQLTVPRTVRRLNARQGMRMRWRWGGWRLSRLHIVVVDDVRTTGSSMAAAARLLRSHGAERVVEAVVAVAESGRRSVKSQAANPVEGLA